LSESSYTASRPYKVTSGPILRKSHDPSGWRARFI